MRIIDLKVGARGSISNVQSAILGRDGEMGVTVLRFDVSEWIEGAIGTYSIVGKNADGVAWVLDADCIAVNGIVELALPAAMVRVGYAEFEIRGEASGKIIKSASIKIEVRSAQTTGDVPEDAEPAWIDRLSQMGTKVGEAISEGKALRDEMDTLAQQVATDAGQVAEDRSNVVQNKDQAQSAAGAAQGSASAAAASAGVASSKASEAAASASAAEGFKDQAQSIKGDTAALRDDVEERQSDVASKSSDVIERHADIVIRHGQVTADADQVAQDKDTVAGYRIQAQASAAAAGSSASDSAASAVLAGNNILNGVSVHNESIGAHEDIREGVRRAEAIARGRATSYTFDTRAQLDAWIAGTYTRPDGVVPGDLIVGDNLYIKALSVKDQWWDGEGPSPLEAEAPDLTDYYTRSQVDAKLPINISRSEYEALSSPEAGRVYNVYDD